MTDASPRELLGLAVHVATRAGGLVLAARRGQVDVAGTKSSPTDIVTSVDMASEQLIRFEIEAARPDDGFIGEESGSTAGASGVTWIADPIDGTVNFLFDIPHYAVSLAAQVDDAIVAGVVHNPASGETFTAVRGTGAFLNGRSIHVSDRTDLTTALVGVGYTYRAEVRVHQAVENARLVSAVRDVRRLGAASLDLSFVACGRLDGYVERGLKPWDLAAGSLIATEAGARVSGLNGSPASERLVVAAPEPLFGALESALTDAGFDAWPMPDWPA